MNTRADLDDGLFRILLTLCMAADPTPLTAEEDMEFTALLNNAARLRGYDSWEVAYHEFGRQS